MVLSSSSLIIYHPCVYINTYMMRIFFPVLIENTFFMVILFMVFIRVYHVPCKNQCTLAKSHLVSILCKIGVGPNRASKYSFTLTYPSNLNILLVLHFLYPPVDSSISLLMLNTDTMHLPKYHINNTRQCLAQLDFFLVHYNNMPSNYIGSK